MNPMIQGSSAFTASPSVTQTKSKTKIITTTIFTKTNTTTKISTTTTTRKPNSEHQHPERGPLLHCLTHRVRIQPLLIGGLTFD